MSKLDLDKVVEMIRTEKDPEKLARDLKAMIEQASPTPRPEPMGGAPIADGEWRNAPEEEMSMQVFFSRFNRVICGGNEPLFWQWPVKLKTERQPDGAVHMTLTTTWRP